MDCPYREGCNSYKEAAPSCNSDYRPGYCGISRYIDHINELNKQDAALYDDAGYIENHY